MKEVEIITEPAFYSPESLANFLALKGGEATIRKLRYQGRIPPPDLYIGKKKLPRWSAVTIKSVIARGQI